MATKKSNPSTKLKVVRISPKSVVAEFVIDGKSIRVIESDKESPWDQKYLKIPYGKRYEKFARAKDAPILFPNEPGRIAGDRSEFIEIQAWKTERFGWCFPTLLIKHAGRNSKQSTDRTYAVTTRGELVRIGHGPHIQQTLEIYVKIDRLSVFTPVIELIRKGEIKAHERRDDLSSKRANSRMFSVLRWDS